MRPINRVGEKHGMLTVLSKAVGHSRTHWNCRCDCGSTCVASNSNIGSGNTVSCGCVWSKSVKAEMIGRRFGLLTVVANVSSKVCGKAKFARYKCACDCGGEIDTLGMSLRNGDTKSCGCAYKKAGEARVKPAEHHRFVANLNNKRRRAARVNAVRPFDAELFKLVEAEAYSLSALRSASTGIKHNVDHVVPLRSKLVCGLHNEFNFQVITADANNRKGNRYWPDMPV